MRLFRLIWFREATLLRRGIIGGTAALLVYSIVWWEVAEGVNKQNRSTGSNQDAASSILCIRVAWALDTAALYPVALHAMALHAVPTNADTALGVF